MLLTPYNAQDAPWARADQAQCHCRPGPDALLHDPWEKPSGAECGKGGRAGAQTLHLVSPPAQPHARPQQEAGTLNSSDLRGRQSLCWCQVPEREPRGLGVATRTRVTTPRPVRSTPRRRVSVPDSKGSILINTDKGGGGAYDPAPRPCLSRPWSGSEENYNSQDASRSGSPGSAARARSQWEGRGWRLRLTWRRDAPAATSGFVCASGRW